MPATSTTYTGINRTVSDFLPSGACEELVNLRPTDTGLRPVNPHRTLMTGVDFTHFWTHRIGTRICRIVRVPVSSGSLYEYRWIDDEGQILQTLITVPSDADDHFAILGNMVVISCKGTQQTYVFRFLEGSYKAVTAETPTVNPSFSASDAEIVVVRGAVTDRDTTDTAFREYVSSGANHIQEENKGLCFGTVLVALSWHTKDGEDYNTFYWKRVNEAADANVQKAADSYVFMTSKYYENGEYLALIRPIADQKSYISLVGSKLTMTIPMVNGIDTDTTMLDSLNVWASKPILPYDPAIATIDNQSSHTGGENYDKIYMRPTPFADNEPGKQLLYLQKRIPIADLVKGQYTLDFEFGGNIQTTNKTLEVDGGILTRFGKMLQYNSRLHYYDSVVKRGTWYMTDVFSSSYTSLGCYLYLTVQEDGADKIINIPGLFVLNSLKTLNDVIVPNMKATRLWMQKANTLSDIQYVDLTPSDRYNYAHAFGADIETSSDTASLETARQNSRRDYIIENEYQDLNVTEQMNPFVFDVDHSYRFPGRILDVQTQIVQASDVAFGVEPLNVFTDAGTYALSQGTGTTLYGNINIVNNLVSEGNSVSTKYGTFMLAAGGLWLVAGRHTTLVSEALREGPHRDVAYNADYRRLTESNLLYHIEMEVPRPDVSFRTYVTTGATLAFDPYEEAIIVSNRDYKYSYVLSLKYRQWYKITGSLSQSSAGDDVVLELNTSATALTKAVSYLHINAVNSTPETTFSYVRVADFNEVMTESPVQRASGFYLRFLGEGKTTLTFYATNAGDYLTYDEGANQLNDALINAGVDAYVVAYYEYFTVYIGSRLSGYTTVQIDVWPEHIRTRDQIRTFEVTPETNAGTVERSAKNYGITGTITIGTWSATWTIQGQTAIQTANIIAGLLNDDPDSPATASSYGGGTLILTARAEGSEGNNIPAPVISWPASTSVTTGGITYTQVNILPAIDYSSEAFSGGGNTIIVDSLNVIDLSQTVSGLVKVHLQTRPLSPGQYMYTHIHRAVQMVRSALGNTCNLTVSLYGSDDLKQWVLLSCAQRTNVNVSQIRTNPAPRSWRYYTIVVGGVVLRDTDFGPVLLDFTQSVRRIG